MKTCFRKKEIILIVFCAFVFIVGSSLANPICPSYGGSFIVGTSADPATLNAAISSNVYDKMVGHNIFSMLFQLGKNVQPVPDLAYDWSISEDGLTYTFHLLDGIKWHDGKLFTSEDVKFTFEEILLKFHPRAGTYLDVISEIETPDSNTVIFKLRKPFGAFMGVLGYDLYIMPKHLYKDSDILTNPYNTDPIGTGPFKFKEWKRGSHVILEKNPEYFKEGTPYLDNLIFKIIPDASSRIMALEAGDIDYLAYLMLPASSVPRFKSMEGFTVTHDGFDAVTSTAFFSFNLDNDVLKDLKVRQAIAYAIDKQFIADFADYGLGKPATGPINAKLIWAYEPDVPRYDYNTELSKKLLDEAGYAPDNKGVRLKLRLIAENTEFCRKATEIIKEQLDLIGIEIDLQIVDVGVEAERVYINRDFDLNLHVFGTGPDPSIGLARLFISENIRPVAYTNVSGYRNEQVDGLFEKAATASKTDERAKYYKEIQKITMSDLPYVPIIDYGITAVWNNDFHGLHEWSGISYYVFWDTWYKN